MSSRNKEAFVALQSNKKASNKKSKNPYSWELYCGTNMKYDTRQSFLQWLYQPLVTRKSTVILNGLTCYQCKHYARFGSHSGLECNKNGANKAKARAMIAVKSQQCILTLATNQLPVWNLGIPMTLANPLLIERNLVLQERKVIVMYGAILHHIPPPFLILQKNLVIQTRMMCLIYSYVMI